MFLSLPVNPCQVPANVERWDWWLAEMAERYPGVDWNVGPESMRQTRFVVSTGEYDAPLNTTVGGLLARPGADVEKEIKAIEYELAVQSGLEKPE
jgi:hypothetical protein